MPSFKIRRAKLSDMDVLVDHRNAMFDDYGRMTKEERTAASGSYPLWAKEMMRKKLFHGYIVESDSGRVAASGCVWLRQQQPSRGRPASLVPYVMSIYTDPKFRRKGLASMVMMETMVWAKKGGYPKMLLHASPVGRKVYSQLGWKRTWEMEFDLKTLSESPRVRPGGALRPSKPSRAAK